MNNTAGLVSHSYTALYYWLQGLAPYVIVSDPYTSVWANYCKLGNFASGKFRKNDRVWHICEFMNLGVAV